MGIPQAMDDLGVLPFQETNREKPPILCGLLKIVINNDNNNNNRNNRNRTQQRSIFLYECDVPARSMFRISRYEAGCGQR